MPVNYYPNKTLAELSDILDTLRQRQLNGTLTEVQAAGVRTVREVSGGSARVETEILRVMYAQYLVAQGTDEEDKYPNPYADKITRTRAHYTFS